MPLRAVFFDLDYTLYDMEQYLRGAYQDVARRVAETCPLTPEALFVSLWDVWREVGTDYGFLFNDWLYKHHLFTPARLERCIDIFHAHSPDLALYAGVEAVLDTLAPSYLLGLITDGHLRMQQSKVAALRLEERFGVIVYSAQLGRSKPDPAVFEQALARAGVSAGEALYVGDHPRRDIVGARAVGMVAIRAMTGEFKALPDDATFPPIDRVDDLRALAGRIGDLG